ncbi:CvfB family protein [Candidatus Enterococcus murrayae]|uniref:DNA-binding protein n=1 Tax=Candidatus Enterococcus murrayae TaxID=2815321 RepID=A0ABS3HFE6_9ENTE|nr:S1-like domain-containing RNA-binding protein [Enterococcus sp. MJM16]MBO0452172.1 DNA-binding protein [Enterococcus sp. MJM16]
MNELLGQVFTGLIIDENEKRYLVQKNGVTFQLLKDEGETHEVGESVEGFAYVNQKRDAIFTTKIPQVRIGHYAFGEVTDVRRDLGVFVNIGLADKDMVVSLDEMPSMKELWPKKGDQLMISLRVDEKDRMWGVLADEAIFHSLSRIGNAEMQNENKKGTIYRLKVVGSYLITDDFYIGFIHPSERYQEPRLGEIVEARVIGVRPDGVLNMSLKPRSHEMINDDAAMILTMLQRNDEHKLPYWDKSAPDEIKEAFGISKGQFKRAIGHLLKEKLIEQIEGEIHLKS